MRLASRGLREHEGHVERLDDAGEAATLRTRANAIVARALLIATAASVATWVAARIAARLTGAA